jgi:hypothetical protein
MVQVSVVVIVSVRLMIDCGGAAWSLDMVTVVSESSAEKVPFCAKQQSSI